LINTGKVAAYRQRHTRILLLADQESEGTPTKDDDIAEVDGIGRTSVERVRKRLVA
jgi:hypothetical protein